jgi:hypothetical protein
MAAMGMITAGICDPRNRVQRSSCIAAVLSRACRIWVTFDQFRLSAPCRLCTRKRPRKQICVLLGMRSCSASGLYHVGFCGRYQGNNGHRAKSAKMSRMSLSVTSPPLNAALRKVYSITSSASASSVCGMVRPSASAVLRLITSSNLVPAWFPVAYLALMQDTRLMRQFRPSARHIKEVCP